MTTMPPAATFAKQSKARRIVVSLLFAFAAVCAAGSVYLGYTALLLRFDGAETAGHVLSLRELAGHRVQMNKAETSPTYLVRYAYRVSDQRYEDRRSVSKELFDNLKRTGGPLTVRYLRSDPQVNEIDSGNLLVGTFILAGGALLFAACGVFLGWFGKIPAEPIDLGL